LRKHRDECASNSGADETVDSLFELTTASRGTLTLGIVIAPIVGQEDALIRTPLGMDLVRAWESNLDKKSYNVAGIFSSIRMNRTVR
jgi:hypothetical protein